MTADTRHKLQRRHGVAVSVVIMCFLPLSLAVGCTGVFYPAIASDLGIEATLLSYFTSIDSIAALVALPLVGRLMERLDSRICIGGASALIAASFIIRACMDALWQFYLAGVLVGFAIAMMLFVAPSTLINRWYGRGAGAVLGTAMAFTGIGGMVWSSVSGSLIIEWGWREAYALYAVLSVAFILLVVLLVRDRPASLRNMRNDVDERRSQASNACRPSSRDSVSAVCRSRTFILICALSFLLNIGIYVYYMIPSYAVTVPSLASNALVGAWASSFAMAGQTLSKVVLGFFGERHPLAGILGALSLGAAGICCFAFVGLTPCIYCLSSLCFGFYYGINTVIAPLLTRRAFGDEGYERIYSRVSMAALAANIVAAFAWGTLIATTQSYMPMFGAVLALMALSAVCAILAIRSKSSSLHS